MRTIRQCYFDVCKLLDELPDTTLRENLRRQYVEYPSSAEPSVRHALNWLRQQPSLLEHIKLELITIRLES